MMSDRQARLAALAAKAGRIPQQQPADQGNEHSENNIDEGNSSDGGDDDVPSKPTPTPTLSFRNYVPKDASLDAPPPSLDAADDNITNKRQKTSTNSIAVSSTTTCTNTPPKSALEIALANTDREARMAAGQTVAATTATGGGATTTNDVGGGGGGWNTVVTPSASTKKVNWDLKRDIQHKMDKLEKRTQRAIVQLLRERLEKEAETAGGVDDYDDEVGDID